MTCNKPTSEPLVTVIALCYNHKKYVEECLESIKKQSYGSTQLVITDDCSTDNSVEIINEWLHKNSITCTFVNHTVNAGLCKTLNEALSYAKGEYISIIATDDVWMEGKIAHQVSVMENLPESVGVLYSDAFHIDECSNCLPEMFISSRSVFDTMPEGMIYETLVAGNFIPVMTTLIRTSCFKTVGLYDESLVFEDWDMWLRISRSFSFVYSQYISAKYRVLATSLVRNMGPNGPETLIKINIKCLNYNDNSIAIKNILTKRVGEYAETLYKINNNNKLYYLFKSITYNITLKSVILFISACFGFKYSSYLAVKDRLIK